MKNNKRNHIIILLLLIISFSVEAGVNVIGGLSKLINAEPGGTYRGTIVISNPGAEPQQVKVYQTDREYNFKGRTHYGSPGENPRSNAEWITFNADIFTIPAKDRFKLEYEVRIPNNTSLMGTYWSMVMIEGIEEPDDSETSEGTIMVRSVSRTGIQITTNIGDTGSREIEFLRSEIINENGSR
ncbi:hypothetical protein KAH81_09030, partial [bacterium]|nr:hypothetical protein [bacterium]